MGTLERVFHVSVSLFTGSSLTGSSLNVDRRTNYELKQLSVIFGAVGVTESTACALQKGNVPWWAVALSLLIPTRA